MRKKWVVAAAAVSVYVFFPAYRYYVIGSWVGYKILHDKPRKPRLIRPGSKLYLKLKGE